MGIESAVSHSEPRVRVVTEGGRGKQDGRGGGRGTSYWKPW